MKKIIIATALILTSAVTAFSLTGNNTNKTEVAKLKTESAVFNLKNTSAQKSDIATAD